MPETVKFGTSGLRGLAEQLLAGPAFSYTSAFCRMVRERYGAGKGMKVLVGRDLRPSSPAIADQVLAAVAANGFEAADCEEVPTPALALAAQAREACAIMVTGSHIPADRNGIKFYSPAGEITKMDEEEIAGRAGQMETGGAVRPDSITSLNSAVIQEWLERCAIACPPESLSGMRIGIMMGSSVATSLMARIIEGGGAQVLCFGQSEGFVPLDTEAVEPGLLDVCREQIRNEELDCVISADPDGDRPLVIDDEGSIIRGDMLGWMAAQQMGAAHVATTVSANSQIASGADISVTRTRIGSPYVVKAIEHAASNGGLAVGFEPNGGFLLGGNCIFNGKPVRKLVTRDSFLPILLLLANAAATRRKISAIAGEMKFNAAASGRLVEIDPAQSQNFLQKLGRDKGVCQAFFAPFGEVASIDRTDGMRFTLAVQHSARRIVHLRASGNAPELRCYVEDTTEAGAQSLLEDCLQRTSLALDKIR